MAKLSDKCGDCRFFLLNANDKTIGDCHRNPPALVVVPVAPGPMLTPCFTQVTAANIGCGEFKAG